MVEQISMASPAPSLQTCPVEPEVEPQAVQSELNAEQKTEVKPVAERKQSVSETATPESVPVEEPLAVPEVLQKSVEASPETLSEELDVSQVSPEPSSPETGPESGNQQSPVPENVLLGSPVPESPVPVKEELEEFPTRDPVPENIPITSHKPEECAAESPVPSRETSPEVTECLLNSCEEDQVRETRADSGFKTMSMETKEDSSECPAIPAERNLIFEYEGKEATSGSIVDDSAEWIDVQTAPAILQTADFETALGLVQTATSDETNDETNQSFEILTADNLENLDKLVDGVSNVPSVSVDDSVEDPLSTITERTEKSSLSVVADLHSRTRTESERREEADWTNSPIMKIKNTPVVDETTRGTKEMTPVNGNAGTGEGRRPSKSKLSKKRLDVAEDDRASTTTPDSTKDNSK